MGRNGMREKVERDGVQVRNWECEWFQRRKNHAAFYEDSRHGPGVRMPVPHNNRLEGVTSFFFSYFRDDYGRDELRSVFSRYGNVLEVFIPQRKDNLGNRFGFVRFLNVRNVNELKTTLNWIHTS